MVLIKRHDSDLFLVSSDNIIRYNLEDKSDVQQKIQKPILPENLKQSQIEVLSKEDRNINCLEFSPSGHYFVVTTENKQIVVYDKSFRIIKNVISSRAPSKACFTPSDDLVVADKTGDVYLYKLKDDENKPVLLLGHLSVILDLTISNCGKYIITSDRDEKIRVSHFPNSYNIASYCLGHTEFVNKIQIINNVLISASGDGTIRFWEFIVGKQLGIIDCNVDIKDNNLLQEFSQLMNKEKVEVAAIPITDMQISIAAGNKINIAVSLYNYNYLHLYFSDLSNFNSNFITKLKIDVAFSFCYNKELYIFYNKLDKFELAKEFIKRDDVDLDKLYEKYKSMLLPIDNNSFTVLYKRKFDNVQEYLERKKQRL